MGKALLSVPSFTAGELSPRMEGRTDFQKYYSAGTIINNFVIQPHGPVTRRPGSVFISEVKNSAHNTRLIPFSFSTTQTYILEFGDQYIRFYKDSGQITSSGSAYEISSPYLHTEVFDIKFAQSADVMYLTHPNHPPKKLSRTGHTNFTLATVSFTQNSSTHLLNGTSNYPKCVSFFEQRLVFAGTINNPQTLWFSKSGDYENFTTGTNDADAMIYTIASNQVNAIESIKATRTLIVMTTGGEFTVTSGASQDPITPTNLNIRKQSNYGSSGVDAVSVGNSTLFLQRAKRKIRELAYNFDSDSYVAPDLTILAEHITDSGVVQMDYQQEPFSIIWCVRDDGKLVALTYNRLQDVVAWHAHEFGGISQECTITVTDYANIATGTKLTFTKSDGTEVIFTSSTTDVSGKFHTETSNNQTATNLKTLIDANSSFTATVSSNVVTIKETTPTVGGFLSCVSGDTTRLAVQNQAAAKCKSVAIIDIDTAEDQVYTIVERVIDGGTKKYVEYLSTYDFNSSLTEFHFVDSGLAYSGSSTTSLSGLSHLEGETVKVIVDGATHPDRTVSSGAISLERSATTAKVGLGFISTLQTMRLDEGFRGTDQTKTKRIYDVTVRFFETVGAKVGPNESNLDEIQFRDSSASMTAPVPLFTGDKETEFPSDYGTDGFVLVKQEQALPMTILALYPRLETHDD